MSDGVNLGVATLGLEANLAQLRGDLDDAKARVALAVAEMQAELDRLHLGLQGGLLPAGIEANQGTLGLWAAAQDAALADVRRAIDETDASYAGMATAAQVAADMQVASSGRVVEAYAAQAIAAKAAADAEEAAAGRSALARSILGGIGGHGALRDVGAASSDTAIWGVRGPTPHPFSATNPGTVVIAAADRTPLGSLAAAIGEDAQSGGPESLSVSTERNNTRTVVGSTPLAEQQRQKGAVPALIGLDAQRQQVMEGSLARALTALEAAQRPSAGKATTIAGITEEDQKVAEVTGSAVAEALAGEAAAKAAIPGNVAPGQFASAALADAYAVKGLTAALGPDLRMRVYGEGGVPGTHTFGVLPGAAVGGAAGTGGPGGSGGGGGVPPWLAALLWGHGGGGGGGGGTYGLGLAGRAFGGAMGIGAGFGSLGSFAGFGPEHIILTAGGIAGSGVAALGGGALLGAGALGKVAAGGGADALVGASAIADTKTLYTAYEKLREAVAEYGKGSEQANEAQKELNATMKGTLSGTPGVTAELHLAEKLSALNVQWDKQTSTARVAFVKLAEPLIEIASKWIPLINTAATQNFDAMGKALEPFFAYLKGPEAMGIFLQLESEFKNEIPTAMQALDQGFQLFGKTVAYTAPLTGGFLKDLDRFFTKWNTPSEFAVWEGEMNKLITDFDVWKAFIHELGGALVDLFDKDAHTGETIIETLTAMLHKVREYENSTAGAAAIRNIFTVHKEEVVALLGALVPLISSFTHIYTTVSPPLVAAVTNIAEAFTKVLTTIEKAGPLGTWAIGLTLIAAKLKVLSPLLAALKTELFGVAAAEGEAAAGATTLAEGETAAGAGAVAEGAGSSGALGGLLGAGSKSLLLKGGLAGFVGLLGGSALAGAVGAKGTLGSGISAAGAGAGLGFVAAPAADALLGTTIGGPIGAAIGAAIGFGTPYLVKGISDLFSSGQPAFKSESAKIAKDYSSYSTALLGHPTREAAIRKELDAAKEAEAPRYHLVADGRGGGAMVQTPGDPAAAAQHSRKAGEEAGKEYVEGFQHVRFPSRLGVLTSMEQQLAKLPAAARTSAAKTMLEYAQKLEAEGRLPQGVIAGFVTALEHKVGGLTGFLIQEGAASARALQKGYELTQARSTLKNSLVSVQQLFGASFKDTTTGTEEALHFLNEIVRNNKGPMGQAAKEMASALKEGLEVEWIAAKEVNKKEIASINAELKTEIKQLGGSEIRAGFGGATAPGKEVVTKGTNFGSEPTPFGKAQGGLLQIGRPGDAGHDTVGLNVGGLPIAVGSGEQVAVFNRHQQPIVNAALEHMGYGGLPGLFGAVTTPNYMAAGGLIPDVVQAGLADVRKDARAKVAHASSLAGSYGGQGGKGSGGSPSANERLGREMMIAAGFPASEWPYLQKLWTKESGWSDTAENQPGAGWLADGNASGIPQSDGHGNVYPKGDARAQIAWGLNYLKSTWHGNIQAAYLHDLADLSYSTGGLLGFAGGGVVPPSVTAKFPQRSTAGKIPKGIRAHTFGKIPPVNTEWSGQSAWGSLNALMSPSGEVAKLIERYGLEETAGELALSKAPHAGAFVITPNALEKAAGITAPFEDVGNVELRSGQLAGLSGTEQDLLGELTQAWNWSQQVLGAASAAVKERNSAISELRARIKANLKKIGELREAIKRQEAALAKIPTGKHATAADRAHAAKLKQEIANEHGQLKALEIENQHLGGSASSIGTGGNIGSLLAENAELTNAKASTEGWVTELGGATGGGGKRQEAKTAIAKLEQQMVELGQTPERLKEALLESGAGPESALELKERELVQSEERAKLAKSELLISNQALSVFGGSGDIGTGGLNAYAAAGARGMLIPASWIPSIPSYDVGGIVPGPVGSPTLAVVHGQEQVLTPAERGGTHYHQTLNVATLHPGDPDTLAAIGRAATRGQRLQGAKLAKRLVPGV